MLINLSNHPSSKWSPEQLAAARIYGQIIDLSFPAINPDGDEEYIRTLCEEYLQKINDICRDAACRVSTVTVHIMGEMTFTFAMINILQKNGIACVASTTERIVTEENGVKTSEFQFKQFRKYLIG